MNWIKNILKPKNKPFFDDLACEKYYRLYESPHVDKEITIYRILREIRHKGRDLCSIDSDLKYTYQFKNGKIKEINLKKTGRRKSATKLFERMTQSIEEIKSFNSELKPIDENNQVIFTFLTNFGTFQDVYGINEYPENGISAYVFTTFWNYVDLVDPKRQKRI